MADQKRFRVYMETRVSGVVEVAAPDVQTALDLAPDQGPEVSTPDRCAWDRAADWESLAIYDAASVAHLYPQPATEPSPRAQDATLTARLGVYATDKDARQEVHADITAFRSEVDGAFVVQIDTAVDLGQLRVFVNDSAVYNADPATGVSMPNVDTTNQEDR